MAPPIHRPTGKIIAGAVTTVAAVYGYFLLFAQFGFLKAVLSALGDDARAIRPIMAVMGLAGIAGSVAAWIFAQTDGRGRLATGLAICAGAAACSLGAQSPAAFYATALLTGLGTGLTTVTLAGELRRAVGDKHLGLIIGGGTGLAYACCNLPVVFEASATTQAQLALLTVGAGMLGSRALAPRVTADPPAGGDYSKAGIAVWVVVFLVLVGLDSASFFIIQHTPGLKADLWTGSGQLMLNAGAHFGAAVLAGWAFDRRWLGRAVALGAAALVLACLMIAGQWPGRSGSGLLYIAGVSVYSAALVFYPASSGRIGLAALIYAVAGWAGSALGIGLAQGRTGLSPAMVMGLAVILAMGLMGRRLASRRAPTMNENSMT